MKKLNYLTISFIMFISACSLNTGQTGDKEQTICIWDGVPIQEEPFKGSKSISKINLGETLFYLGQSVIDSADRNREYLKIELSDGNVAWARSYGLVVGAKVAAIKENVPVYERPDLLSLTEKIFYKMNVVAIVEVKEDWIKVIGKEKKTIGWINNRVVTENKEDVAVAILAAKKVIIKNDDLYQEKIEDFLKEIPYKNSIFIDYLRSKVLPKDIVEIPKDIVEIEPVENDSIELELIEEVEDSTENIVG